MAKHKRNLVKVAYAAGLYIMIVAINVDGRWSNGVLIFELS